MKKLKKNIILGGQNQGCFPDNPDSGNNYCCCFRSGNRIICYDEHGNIVENKIKTPFIHGKESIRPRPGLFSLN